jgi:membrane protein involved in colicin uptake
MSIQQAIQERSYFIWVGEGRPHGRDLEHWLTAEVEMSAGREAKPKAARAKRAAASVGKAEAKSAAKPAAKRAAAKRPAPREA